MDRSTLQWLAVLVLIALGTATGLAVHRRPLDAERLHVQVDQLASFAAEERLLARAARARTLPSPLAEHQAAQHARAFGKALDKLREAQVQAPLERRQQAAIAAATQSVAGVEALADGRRPAASAEAAAEQLSALAHALEDEMP